MSPKYSVFNRIAELKKNVSTFMPVKNSLGLFSAMVFLSVNVNAENTYSHATGFIPEQPEAYALMPQAPHYQGNLPAAVDFSANFPIPGNQGEQNSAVAWATTYAARSYLESINKDWKLTNSAYQFSPAFVYNQIKVGGCDSGSSISAALNLLKNMGAVPLVLFPYEQQSCSKIPDSKVQLLATRFRIGDWLRVDEQNLHDIKGQIYTGNPVIVGMTISDEFQRLTGKQIYNEPLHLKPEEGHALVIVGYDDNKKAFKLINSWGTAWGDNGFGWVSYAAFQKRIQNAFVISKNQMTAHSETTSALPIETKENPLSRPELERKLAELLGKIPCAKLSSVIAEDSSVSLSGFVGERADVSQVLTKLQALGVKVSTTIEAKPSPQCEVLRDFSDVLAIPTDLHLTIAGSNNALLREGEQLTIEITTPSYPSYLYLTYIQANGDAVHLLQPTAKTLTPIAANTTLVLGDGRHGNAQFKIRKPFGSEMIVAIASATPLFNEQLPKTQTKRRYLSQFQDVFAMKTSANTTGQVISGAIATLITQAKP
jgi:C1A family cysteine protease